MGFEEAELRKRSASDPCQEAEAIHDGAFEEEQKKDKKTIGRTPDGTGTLWY